MDTDYFPRRSVSDEHPLPTPSDTPYQTPHLSSTRLSSFGTALSTPLTTPPLPPKRYEDRPDQADKDQVPHYDRADFTPTLHASLVSEILTLRRDVESKHGLVDELESTLASTRTENETLQNNLKRTGKETRALKRQLQLHEDGTLSAMESMAKERDDVNEANSELRKRLELSQKKLRSHEEETKRLKESLETERHQRADERRGLERKAQLAEHRLAVVLNEVTTATPTVNTSSEVHDHVEPAAAGESEAVNGSDIMMTPPNQKKKLRYDQTNSVGSIREMKPSLADELSFIESEDEALSPGSPDKAVAPKPERMSNTPTEVSDFDLADYESRLSHARSKRFSKTEDGKARKVLGMVSVFEDQMKNTADAERERIALKSRTQGDAKGKLVSSPPTRPTSKGGKQLSWYSHDSEKYFIDEEDHEEQENQPPAQQASETSANQRRKREPPTLRKSGHVRTQSEPSPIAKLSPQNNEADEPSSATSLTSVKSFATATENTGKKSSSTLPMTSTSTQTEPFEIPPSTAAATPDSETSTIVPTTEQTPPPAQVTIPAIQVQAPDATHPAPVNSLKRKMTPPETRHIGSQTRPMQVVQTRSVAIQTEVIRIDQRPVKLPAHLLPSALNEQLKAQEQAKSAITSGDANHGAGHARDKPPRANEKTLAANDLDSTFLPPLPPLEELDDDFNHASIGSGTNTQRVSRSIYSSPPLSSTGSHLPDLDEPDDLDLSDIEYGTNLSSFKPSHRTQRHSRTPLELPTPVPENEKFVLGAPPHARHKHSTSTRSARSSLDKGKKRLTTSTDASSQYQSRLAFLTRNGSSAGSRSPSLSSNFSTGNFSKSSAARPPFVIPTRRSSKEPVSKVRSARGSGLSSPTRGGRTSPRSYPHKNGRVSPSKIIRREQSERPPKKEPRFLRKARSATAINTSKGPADTFGIPSNLGPVTQTPQKPPFPAANIAYGQEAKDAGGHPDHPHVSTMFPTGSASVGSVKLQHNVVDAITATMIGEWMWKYTRKRISFGTNEQDASDVRHRRWVWLSPYERTVMWSNKQPISNTALMGKTGRKLSIQSVIDVKDDIVLPKEARGQPIFDRSILVLTPARALKFTASTRERHFMWLTALSFLAHQTDKSIPNYQFNPPPPPSIPTSSVSSTRSRASSFRNPLRPSKSRNTSQQTSGAGTPITQNFDPNAQRPPLPKAPVPESAFAPAVPRVPHSRKRSLTGPSRKTSSFASLGATVRGRPTLTSRNSSAGNSTARVHSQSGDSARRTPHAEEEEPVPNIHHHLQQQQRMPRMEPKTERIPELSPRQSIMGADFGGNNSFFDAVGVMRMDAIIRAPDGGASAGTGSKNNRSGKEGNKTEQQPATATGDAGGHHRHDSSGSSFQGPPDISKTRPLRRIGNNGGLRAERERARDEPFAGF